MSIVINSLTPVTPVASAGSSVTFVVDAFETGGASLTYLWQFSTDGNTYTSSGLTNNTSATYTTSNLTINQSGLYFRVAVSDGVSTIFSNLYPSIGDRIITVVQDPSIITLVNPLVDNYPNSQIVEVGNSVSFVASATLIDADISNTTLVSQINFQWQYSDDDGSTWINLTNGGNIAISNTVDILSSTPTSYYKYSTLLINNITFDNNLYRYRSVVTFNGALNTPVNLPAINLIVSPEIQIYRQPGAGDDTIQTKCYKTSDINSGKIKLQVGALSTANTTLNFSWEASLDQENWQTIDELVSNRTCILDYGTSSNSDVIRLERFIYSNIVYFRCIISGISGEASVISDTHAIFMNDTQVNPVVSESTVDVIEDRYGDIPDRQIYINDIVRAATITASIDINSNTGINGETSLIFERKNPGDVTWYEVGEETIINPVDGLTSLPSGVEFPSTTPNFSTISYTTPPVRKSVDDQALYRLKVTSSSIYNLNANTKNLIPYYSSVIQLNVYRSVIIDNQPFNTTAYPNANASFSVGASVTSGSADDITYVWQYNTTNSISGWQNIPSNSQYSGVTTNLLTINSVPLNPTYRFFRCIVNISGQLASVTTEVAQLTITRDFFVEVTSLNDIFAREFDSAVFTVNASSVSSLPVSYSWEKSTNYNPSNNFGNWTTISGENTNTLNFLSLSTTNQGYYRAKLTTFGGEIRYTNAAFLSVVSRTITITKNIPSSITVLESDDNAYTFETSGNSSLGGLVNYKWQIKRVGDSSFSGIGVGFQNAPDNTNIYFPLAFNKDTDNLSLIRCELSSDDIPNNVYTNQCTVNVRRRLSYFGYPSNLNVVSGGNLVLDLNPTWTGGTPTFQWQTSTDGNNWSNIQGETNSFLSLVSINSSFNGKRYRCQITLPGCDEYFYSVSNTSVVQNVSTVGFTTSTTINVVASTTRPKYYSLETQKSGAAIGTVICVPKPAGFTNNTSTNADDITSWKVSVSGSYSSATSSSTVTSGGSFSANKPSWATNYISPKWNLSDDRFQGYLEMRGQFLKAVDFPELARLFGTTYGGSISGQYPSYTSNDTFRMPNLYAKKLLGTGNVNNNSGSVSVTPLYGPDEASGGLKNLPGSIGGRYNWGILSQLPPGSPGVGGGDGVAGIDPNPATFNIGSFVTKGVGDSNAFVQPTFSGTVTYNTGNPGSTPVTTPVHSHRGVIAAWEKRDASNCGDKGFSALTNGLFFQTRAGNGLLEQSPPTTDQGVPHSHGVVDGSGSFNMVTQGGINISDTTLTLSGQSQQVFNSSLRFYLRNAEDIPINSAYFRLKYMIKAY